MKMPENFTDSLEAVCAQQAQPGDQVRALKESSGTGMGTLKATFRSEAPRLR